MIIQHNLKKNANYIPKWEIEYLFVGTFNPQNHIQVPYYYGRDRNQTWKILSKIFETDLDPNEKDFISNIKNLKIACIDMVDSVEFDEKFVNSENIIGNGYSDKAIINNKVKRKYNTSRINEVISKNRDNIKVFSTWGKGPNLQNWTQEIEKIEYPIINLNSPSLAARVPKGQNKFNYMLQDWKKKIII